MIQLLSYLSNITFSDSNDPIQHLEVISGQSSLTGSMTGDDCSLAYDEIGILQTEDSDLTRAPDIKAVDAPVLTRSAVDVRDAIICESIRRAYETMDSGIKSQSNSGSTVTSIYLDWDISSYAVQDDVTAGETSRPVKVYCANVGDSRCIMLKSYDTATALTLPSFYKRKTDDSIYVRSMGLASEKITTLNGISAQENVEEEDKITVRNKYSFLQKSPKSEKVAPLAALQLKAHSPKGVNRFTAVHLMSEDHKLSLSRERSRITENADSRWHSLPSDASAIFLPLFVRTAPPLSQSPAFSRIQCAGNQGSASSHGFEYELPTKRCIVTTPIQSSSIRASPSKGDQNNTLLTPTKFRGVLGFEYGHSNTSHGALSNEKYRACNTLEGINGKREVRLLLRHPILIVLFVHSRILSVILFSLSVAKCPRHGGYHR